MKQDLAARLADLHACVDAEFPNHLETTKEFLRIPSVSADTVNLRLAADYLKRLLERLGAKVELVERGQAPIVYARLEERKEKTLLIYGMYDVQPVIGQTWSCSPFEAAERDVEGVGRCLVARGACNSKGPLIGFLNALATIRRSQGQLPVNLLFTIEGEEESGSPGLAGFYEERRRELRAQAAFEPFWAEYGTDVDRPTVALGTKGAVTFQLVCRGGDWGGPVFRPVHSSVAAWVASPTWRLIRALGLLVDEHGDVLVPELRRLVPSTEEDEVLLQNLAPTLNEESLLALATARNFKHPLHGADLLREYYFSPTMHLMELQGTDGETIPTEATAKLFIRLPPGLRPDAAIQAVQKHLIDQGLGDIGVTNLGGYSGVRSSARDAINLALVEAYRLHGCQPQIIPFFASSSPYYVFTEILGIPYASGGLGKASGSHSPNEYLSIDGLNQFEKSIITLLYVFASPVGG